MKNYNFINFINIPNIRKQVNRRNAQKTNAHRQATLPPLKTRQPLEHIAILRSLKQIFQDGRENSSKGFQVWDLGDQT